MHQNFHMHQNFQMACKNQLMMAEAARRAGVPLIIAGHTGSQAYADLVAEALADYLVRHPDKMGRGHAQFLTTGNPRRVSDRATQFLRRQITFEAA